ncbi:hypothetical protein Taro_048950 [Colocasia esculenta]|uniref:CCHC-type domain-containing protein n=1 Tax=Colocasia esculenta TaxID=4460 RepID=A0A843X9R2_COLES|nr:hypothetical protein [Colocasia esculenta]
MVKRAQCLEDAAELTERIKGRMVKKELTSGAPSKPTNGKKRPLSITDGPSQERKPKVPTPTTLNNKPRCKHCDKLGHTAEECWRKVSRMMTTLTWMGTGTTSRSDPFNNHLLCTAEMPLRRRIHVSRKVGVVRPSRADLQRMSQHRVPSCSECDVTLCRDEVEGANFQAVAFSEPRPERWQMVQDPLDLVHSI